MQSALAADVRMPGLAPLVLLAFLGTGFVLAGAAAGAAIALAAGRRLLARSLAAAGLSAAVIYGTVLLAASLASREKTLAPGRRKYFCEMDCHLAYQVTASAAPSPTTRAVTVRTWFDPDTIGPGRGDAPLTPNPRVVWLEDASGRRFAPSAAATRAWENAHGSSVTLTRSLRPGESYTTTFVFEVPPGLSEPRLFLGDPAGPESLMIGHENSPFHGAVYFALEPARSASRSPR